MSDFNPTQDAYWADLRRRLRNQGMGVDQTIAVVALLQAQVTWAVAVADLIRDGDLDAARQRFVTIGGGAADTWPTVG